MQPSDDAGVVLGIVTQRRNAEVVQDAIRVASVIQAVAVTLEAEIVAAADEAAAA